MKAKCLDNDFIYSNAETSRRPGYLAAKFKKIRSEQKQAALPKCPRCSAPSPDPVCGKCGLNKERVAVLKAKGQA